MGPIYRKKQIQDTIHQNSSFVICSDQNESILLPVSQRRDRKPSQQTGRGKGTESGNSRLLFPDIPCAKKEQKVSFNNRPIFIKPLHRETSIQNGNSQIGKTSNETQRLGCLHRFNRCIPTHTNTSSIQEVSSLRTRRSSISLFGPTVRNVPKSVNFFETDGRYSSLSTPTCHISFSIPRRLADKKSDSQPTDYSDKILHSNYPKPRFSAKSQEVGSLSCSEIHLHRYGISDATKFSQSSSRSCTEPNSNNQENNVSQTCIGTNFPFSFGQIQCCSRPCSPRQTALTSSSDVPAVCLETSYSSSRSPDVDKRYDSISQWWINPIRFETGTSIHPPDPEFFLYTVASHYGWGAHLEPTTLSFHGRWTENQSQLHINMLKMMAIRLALKQAKTFIHHSCIMISTDNTMVVSYINKQGGTHSSDLCIEVWKILNWCLEQDIVIRVRNIPGKFNVLADRLSRLDKPIKTEWALDQTVANSVFQMLNFPNVDLFATRFIICLSSTRLQSTSDRCPVHGLESSSCICFSSFYSDTCCSRENPTTSVQNSSHSSVLATTTVVLRTSSSISVSSDSPATNSKTTNPIQRKVCPSKPPNSRPSRLGVIKQSIRDKKFSQNVADFVARSRRASTQKVYDAKWTIFSNWCHTKKFNPISAPITVIADFLIFLFSEKKCQISTIKGYRSMIS